ncbi:MAG: hypothetical protein AB8G14_11640 [Ilumatobacter sp.]
MTDGPSEWPIEPSASPAPPNPVPPAGQPGALAPYGQQPVQQPHQQPGAGHYGAPQQLPPGYSPYGQPVGQQFGQSHSKATTSMVLGIVGLASIFFCYGIVSIVMGPIAYFMGKSAEKEIALSPQSWTNAGMARAGWIMGLIQTILSILLLLAVVGFVIWVISVDDANF